MTPGTDWIDQAQRLVEALRGGLTSTDPAAEGPADGADAAPDRHAADCRWCPVCQTAAVLRGERPEVSTALADLLTSAATALRTVAAAGQPAEPDENAPAQESEPPAPVQQIDIA